MRAGGRANGREGLALKGWLEKVELRANSSEDKRWPKIHSRCIHVPLRNTDANWETWQSPRHLCLTSSLLRAVWCGHKCASLGPEVLIKTQTKMIAAGSAEEACERLSVLRSTASQCPGVGEIWSPWAWDRLYYLLSGRLAQEIARRRDGRLGNRIRYVLLWCQRLSWCHLIFACVGIRADNLILMKTGTVH